MENNNKTLAIILGSLAGVLILVLGAVGIALIVSNNDEPTPSQAATPVASATPTPPDSNEAVLDILDQTWDKTPSEQQESLCLFFNVNPDGAFDAFNDGAGGLVPQDTFNEFFSEKCSSSI